jgi:hypothetical protein
LNRNRNDIAFQAIVRRIANEAIDGWQHAGFGEIAGVVSRFHGGAFPQVLLPGEIEPPGCADVDGANFETTGILL